MRLFTKSRFNLGRECPTKLFYTQKPNEYADTKQNDSFLQNLAEGGMVVGELAKLYFPSGQTVKTLDSKMALQETNKLLANNEVTIFEGAILFENLFIRADVLIKSDNQIQLIEVKSKSIDTNKDDPFRGKKGRITSDWQPYLLDLAFQRHVVMNAFPQWKVTSYLMGVDKNQPCTIDGLNQRFRIQRVSDKLQVTFSKERDDSFCKEILKRFRVDEHLDELGKSEFDNGTRTFEQHVNWLAQNYSSDTKIPPKIGKHCKTCEFRIKDKNGSLKDGFRECWSETLNWQESEFDQPIVYELSNFRDAQRHIENGTVLIKDLADSDIDDSPDGKPGLSQKQRRALHIKHVKSNKQISFIDKVGLKNEMDKWKFPLHFIDFETLATSVPIHKGLKPGQSIAFQFSHHMVNENGLVTHANEYLNDCFATCPNFTFLRRLKAALDGDSGTIFRYADHENTIINQIIEQLKSASKDLTDYEELSVFAKSISQSKKKSSERWRGSRNMIDLRHLVARFYFHPDMRGSQSLKHVLPAILNDSKYLQEKYSQPIYGSDQSRIKSHNFTNYRWVKFDGNKPVNPYHQLPNIFDEITNERWAFLEELDAIKEGGSAMTAYLRLQYEELPDEYRRRIRKGLLKYCELDTLAMVMLYEGWRELI